MQTWLPELKFDHKFFVGRRGMAEGSDTPPENIVVLDDVKDDYNSLPDKTLAVIRWAREHGYDYVLKMDDDVYCRPERLHIPNEDYVGHAYGHPNYASGAAYWLSATAMDACLSKWYKRSNAEDACIGYTLAKAGITLTEDPRYRVGWKSFEHEELENMFPHPSNDTITFHMYFPHHMVEMHQRWDTNKQYVTPPTGKIVLL